nr:retrovirus-related Pol polyprotein from transposon TNT 1-94 [Tanacetum cinerariifolium]
HLGKFDAKGDKGYFVGYSLSSKAFRVFNKRTKKVKENLHVDFLENKLIEKGTSPNWLFDIDTLTNSMNYVPVFVVGTSSTNILDCNADVPESSGIFNPTATSKVPSANQVEPGISLTNILTVSSPVPTVCLDISPKSSSGSRLISKGVFSQKRTPSLGNALSLSNRFEDTFGVEADLSNMEISIPGKGSTNPIKPYHTPSPQEHHTPQHDFPPPLHQTILSEPIPQAPTETLTLWRYTRRAIRIAQSKALLPVADEHASLSRDDRQGEAFLTISNLDVGQDRENIAKTSALPHESSPRVPFLDADKDKDAPITRGIIDIGEELGAEKSTEKGSNDTEEMINVLSSMEAANILSSGGEAASVSPADVLPTAGVPTVSGSFPTVSAIFTTASMRLSEQLVRDSKIARIHAKEELKIMIEGLDRSNEVIAKHLSEYKQAEANLSDGEKIELITKQSKPLSKKEQREFYMSVLRIHAGWKTKHFRGMTLEQIKEKFIPVWKQFEDFVPMSSKEESERVKRQGLKIDQGSLKRIKISKDVFEEELNGMMQLVNLE